MATVKLLLKESIKHVGKVGDIVEVSPGYARNYLLPKDLAVEPTPNNVKKIEARRQEIERQGREKREQQARLIKQLEGVEVTMVRRAALCDEVFVLNLYHHEAIANQRISRALQLATKRLLLHFFQLQRAVCKQRLHLRL